MLNVVEKLSYGSGSVASVTPDTGMIVYSTPQYTVGLDVRDGVVVEAPPIAQWAVGRTVDHIWRDGTARGVELRWINPPFGHTVPTGKGDEVVEVAPARCSNGHRLGPYQVIVKFSACHCDKVRPGLAGHSTWACRHPGCGEVLVGDGHADDSDLASFSPRPSAIDEKAARQRQAGGPNTEGTG